MTEAIDDLQCVICHDIFDRPTTLLCGHTYCMGCIFDYLEENPSCPTCKAFVANNNLKVNIAIQKLTERYRRRETAAQNLSALRGAGSTREMKKITFTLCGKTPYFYPKTYVEVQIKFSAEKSQLLALLSNSDFVGMSDSTKEGAYLFGCLAITSLQKGVASLSCQCKQRLTISELKTTQINVGDAAAPLLLPTQMAVCTGKAVEVGEPSEDMRQKLTHMEGKIVFFLKVLRSKNPETFAYLKKKCAFTLTDQLSISHTDDPLNFLELITAMLKLPIKQVRAFYHADTLQEKLDITFNFVDRLGLYQDPVFFFESETESAFNGAAFYFFCALLAVIILTSITRE